MEVDYASTATFAPITAAGRLAGRFLAARQATLQLAAPLSAEDCQVQSMADASPVKWHLAHTTWFFETFILSRFEAAHTPFDPSYRMLFNSYYNAIGAKHPRPERGLLTRPTLEEVLQYRSHVDQALLRLLRARVDDMALLDLVELGINHEQQHQELILTDVKHLLSCNPLKPAYLPALAESASRSVAPLRWIRFDGGVVRQGHTGQGFAFDNETPSHETLLQPYQLADRLVTQGEFAAFIADGGYSRPEFWLSQGWDRVQAENWQAPMYWEADGASRWRSFTLFGMQDVDPSAPVTHVSYFEADAYARWAEARLPRESEWEWAAKRVPAFPSDANMLEQQHFEARPCNGEISGPWPLQMYGDAWEWTSSAYDAYPGFATAAGAVGEYNGKFMCNQFVLRGGSCVTPASHIRATYRNFFPPEARWQFSGIRLARNS
jgi:ergothioneine biosynthesis protein EgtB